MKTKIYNKHIENLNGFFYFNKKYANKLIDIAEKINTQPTTIFSVKVSCRKIVLKRTPKTDSKLRKSDAKDDCTYFNPIF